MARPSGFDPKHLRKQPCGLALRNPREVGDQRNGIAAPVAGGEIAPSAVESVHLEGSEPAIVASRVERDDFRADALAARQKPSQHGRESRQRRTIDFGEVDTAAHESALAGIASGDAGMSSPTLPHSQQDRARFAVGSRAIGAQ